jgi:hypothetical protein
MKVRVLNVDVNEMLHSFASAGFTPVKLNDTDITLLPRKATRDELMTAVRVSADIARSTQGSKLVIFSGGKGRPFTVPCL